jgi:hypothetical protein
MIPLDDPTLETIKQEQEDRNVPEEWGIYSLDIHWLNMKNYMEGQQRTWRILKWRLHNTNDTLRK